MYSAVVFLAMLLGATPIDGGLTQGDFSAQIIVQKWKYNFENEKWEKKWIEARSDADGTVYLKNNQKYAIRIKSEHAYFCNAKVVTNGADRGTWKMEPWQTGLLQKDVKDKPFIYHKGDRGEVSISFTSRHTNDTQSIKLNIVEDR